jgi:hypothetical protein
MWGTTSSCDELTGDFGVGPEVISIGDPRFYCLIAENQSGGVWGLLQHYRGRSGLGRDSGGRPRLDPILTSGAPKDNSFDRLRRLPSVEF